MQVGRIGVRICVIIAHLWVINVVCVLHNSAFLPTFAAVTGYLYPISTLDTLSNQEKVKIMHKKFLLACGLAFAAISAFAQQQWTISVQNQGTAGGYILDKNGKSVGNYSYSQFYPSKGYTPCWVVRFPKGNYTITSGNTGKIDVRNMNTGEDVIAGQSARSFSFRAPETAWYRLLLRDGVTNTEMSNFTIKSTDVTGANAVYMADWRSIPSLHLNGFESSNSNLPSGDAFDWIYDEVLIPADADYLGTYVEAFGFKNGYIGIQNNGRLNSGEENRTIIFSTWDNGDTDKDKALADFKRSGVMAIDSTRRNTVAERFGGEGTGVHVLMNGDYWKPGKWARFLLNVRPEEIILKDGSRFQNTIISAWFNIRGVDEKWHYISSQRMAGQVLYFGSGFNAFLEEFTRGGTSQGIMPHLAYYRRAFTRSMQGGEWYNRNKFWFGHTDGGNNKGARNDRYQTAVEFEGEPAILMQSGGYIEPKDHNGWVNLAYQKDPDYLPADSVLANLVKRDVLPAIQAQDVERMRTALRDTYAEIPQSEWKVAAFSSQEARGENNGKNGLAKLVLDGDNSTFWHTEWMSGSKTNYPHYITFSHNGETTVERITLTTDAGHSDANQYLASTVQVQTATRTSGPWTTVGTYTLPKSATQVLTLDSPLTLPAGQFLRLNFTKGFSEGGKHFMALSEVNFQVKDAAALRTLVEKHFANAGQFNYYATADVEKYLGAVRDHLATATGAELEEALRNLANNARVLKYGPVTSLSDLNAERAYVITNQSGYGTLTAEAGENFPTLRGAAPIDGKNALELYKTAPDLAQANASWIIVGVDHGRTNQYLVFNAATHQFLNPAAQGSNSASTMSDTPVFVNIRMSGGQFVFSAVNQTSRSVASADLCADPTKVDGAALTQRSRATEPGNFWTLSDNYAITPDKALIQALREAAKTGKFKAPTAIHSTAVHGETSAAELYDLQGRRVQQPAAGTVVVSRNGKHIAQ